LGRNLTVFVDEDLVDHFIEAALFGVAEVRGRAVAMATSTTHSVVD
jgi:hypothetical protein